MDFKAIESKWQNLWAKERVFCTDTTKGAAKPKFYALDMFPYPSGHGLHIGHLASYTPTDVIARFKRAQGFNVLHPMGYDAFGLPAEQYAIATGVHPRITTQKAQDNFKNQLQSFGFSFDWEREISTCDPSFYKWTQKIVKILFERDLLYQKEVPVNWCPAMRTVLANEEVVNGRSERGGHQVLRMPMQQWMLRITRYADRLLQGLDDLDWPEATKLAQRNWIGRSEGCTVQFKLHGAPSTNIEVFTTRPDTLFGATFVVLAPEHALANTLGTKETKPQVAAYLEQVQSKSEVERQAEDKKTGVFTGAYAINPFNNEKIPIWIADYVLAHYGTGAIMAVPAHDARDYDFAQAFNLPIRRVLSSKEPLPFEGDGELVESGFLNGMQKSAAIQAAIEHITQKKLGTKEVRYKLRDWVFSRQRYWGEPFPLVEYADGRVEAVSDQELPLTLPEVADYKPSEKGEPPLAQVPEWIEYKNPATGERGRRITDTMPGQAGSSWYFLRYIDPHNEQNFCAPDLERRWMPVDIYIGGAEHSVLHLLYARFWQHVLFDAGLVSVKEPIKKLRHQGVVMGPDGQRMSKSLGNIVAPEEVRREYGADACRLYICFLGPFEKDKPWNIEGIQGMSRFLQKLWRICVEEKSEIVQTPPRRELAMALHRCIKKVTQDIEALRFNTAISALMVLVNLLQKEPQRPQEALWCLLRLLMPFAPHVAEECGERLGLSSQKQCIHLASWPQFDPDLAQVESVQVAVQINGKTRGQIQLPPDASEDHALSMAKTLGTVKQHLGGRAIFKTIYRPNKVLSLVVKD